MLWDILCRYYKEIPRWKENIADNIFCWQSNLYHSLLKQEYVSRLHYGMGLEYCHSEVIPIWLAIGSAVSGINQEQREEVDRLTKSIKYLTIYFLLKISHIIIFCYNKHFTL